MNPDHDPQTPQHPAPPNPVEKVARSEAGAVVVTPATPEHKVDNGVEESFPASDPVSVSITKVEVASDADSPRIFPHALPPAPAR